MPVIPKTLGSKVATRESSWMDLAMRAWGSEFNAPDHGIYVFGNGRKYDSTDRGLTGIYGVKGDVLMVIDGQQYPDMREGLVVGVGYPNAAADGGYGSYQEISADPQS